MANFDTKLPGETSPPSDPVQVVADCLDVLNDEDHPEGHARVFAASILRALAGAGHHVTPSDGLDDRALDVMTRAPRRT